MLKHALIAILMAAAFSPPSSDGLFFSTRVKGSVERSWPAARSLTVRDDSVSPAVMNVRSLWDADSLYFRFDVEDFRLWATQTERDHPELFLDDMCEVLLDTKNDRSGKWQEDDRIFHVNLTSSVKDDCGTPEGLSDCSWNGNESFRVVLNGSLNDDSDVDTGYTIFLSIPWKDLDLTPRPGLRMGMNTGFSDRVCIEGGRRLVFWKQSCPTRNTSAFGEIILKQR